MAATTTPRVTSKSMLKLSLPAIPAWLGLVGIMRATQDGQSNVPLILGLAAVCFAVGLVMLYVFGRSLLPAEKHSLLPKQMLIVAGTWALAAILAASAAWTDDIGGVMQGFSLLTAAMALSYFAKGIGLIDDPDNPF